MAYFLGNSSSSHLWGEVIDKALLALGGVASTQAIYKEIEGSRPTGTKYWKEQIRKVLRKHYRRVAPATYALDDNNERDSDSGVNQQYCLAV